MVDDAKPAAEHVDDAAVAATANALVLQAGALSTAIASNNTDAAIAGIQQ